jgi:hypothetical protein
MPCCSLLKTASDCPSSSRKPFLRNPSRSSFHWVYEPCGIQTRHAKQCRGLQQAEISCRHVSWGTAELDEVKLLDFVRRETIGEGGARLSDYEREAREGAGAC